jgi:hypothetical protein
VILIENVNIFKWKHYIFTNLTYQTTHKIAAPTWATSKTVIIIHWFVTETTHWALHVILRYKLCYIFTLTIFLFHTLIFDLAYSGYRVQTTAIPTICVLNVGSNVCGYFKHQHKYDWNRIYQKLPTNQFYSCLKCRKNNRLLVFLLYICYGRFTIGNCEYNRELYRMTGECKKSRGRQELYRFWISLGKVSDLSGFYVLITLCWHFLPV